MEGVEAGSPPLFFRTGRLARAFGWDQDRSFWENKKVATIGVSKI